MHYIKENWQVLTSLVMFCIGMVAEWTGLEVLRMPWFLAAYLLVAVPNFVNMVAEWRQGDFFNEYFLMVGASAVAFVIGEYPEAVAVLLFYLIGEELQERSVGNARRQIESLLEVCPAVAEVEQDGRTVSMDPEKVRVGDVVLVKPGGRVPLDGVLLDCDASFDTSAITGESAPRGVDAGGEVLSGMLCVGKAIRLRVSKPYTDGAIQRIMHMVADANDRKSPTELFIRRFSRKYVQAVMLLVVLVVLVPYLAFVLGYSQRYDLTEWVAKAAVFMVICCPCALLVSIPLGYFGGIGAASKHGILIKGGNFLDALFQVKAVAFDKTGTLTNGEFCVQDVVAPGGDKKRVLGLVASGERFSSHPLAKAVCSCAECQEAALVGAELKEEFAGRGIVATCDSGELVCGNASLFAHCGIDLPLEAEAIGGTVVHCALQGRYVGSVVLADEPKAGAETLAKELRSAGIEEVAVLSGDNQSQVTALASRLGIDKAYGSLLPQDKVKVLDSIRQRLPVAFIGDGINDAPVLALADVGIAMGAMGSDVAVETADVVIEDDNPLKVATALLIARSTRMVVWQNVALALGLKTIIMVLALLGIANMWMGVFADSGVCLLAVANAIRIQRRHFAGFEPEKGDVKRFSASASHGCCHCHHHEHQHNNGDGGLQDHADHECSCHCCD